MGHSGIDKTALELQTAVAACAGHQWGGGPARGAWGVAALGGLFKFHRGQALAPEVVEPVASHDAGDLRDICLLDQEAAFGPSRLFGARPDHGWDVLGEAAGQ